MARKPNYAFERNARAKAKADKREAKRAAKTPTKTEEEIAADLALGNAAQPTEATSDGSEAPPAD